MKSSRRHFIQMMATLALSGAGFALVKSAPAKTLVRPPAALVETDFLTACTRCNQCIDVCEANALRPASITEGLINLGTPVLDGTKCIMCMECVRVCPTNAIQKVPKEEVVIGKAIINQETCLAWQKKKRCKDCYRACKYKAIEMKKRRYPVIKLDKCNGCGLCIRRCPGVEGTVVVRYEEALRYPAPQGHFAREPENRVAPYEFPPDDFLTWLKKRLEKIKRNHGMTGEESSS